MCNLKERSKGYHVTGCPKCNKTGVNNCGVLVSAEDNDYLNCEDCDFKIHIDKYEAWQ